MAWRGRPGLTISRRAFVAVEPPSLGDEVAPRARREKIKMNRLCAIGRLGADPEMKTTRSGLSVLELRIAIDARTKKGEEWVTMTTWCRASLFGRRAEALQRQLAKGDRVGVTGALHVREFERNDGSKGFSVEILDADITLLGGGGGGARRSRDDYGDFGGGGGGGGGRSGGSGGGGGGGGGYDDFPADDFGEDDIPF